MSSGKRGVEQSVFSIHLPHGLRKLWVLSMALICVEAPISATWYLFIGGFSSQPWL
ncbi:hypothetical protein A225_2557 [Klebsiella michiganensis E718]|nr:hypothetical protein A225_2557 [Klebsiella michiganensis E718]